MNRVFILGAGFSYHISGGQFPLTFQLGKEMRQGLSGLSSFIAEKNISSVNLERILTELDLDLQEENDTRKQRKLKKYISDIRIFLKNRLSLEKIEESQKGKAEKLCAKLFIDNDSIITFNYDCLLEHILWRLKYWSPNGGYGEKLGINHYGTQVIPNPKNIVILKLHGSLNFGEVSTERDTLWAIWTSNDLFPEIYSNLGDSTQMPAVVLPTFTKLFGTHRNSMYLWHEATERVKKADIIAIIGYSLPRSDTMVRLLLSFLNADIFKRKVDRLKIAILNKGLEQNERVQRQIEEVGQFGYEDIEWRLFSEANNNDYINLSNWIEREKHHLTSR